MWNSYVTVHDFAAGEAIIANAQIITSLAEQGRMISECVRVLNGFYRLRLRGNNPALHTSSLGKFAAI